LVAIELIANALSIPDCPRMRQAANCRPPIVPDELHRAVMNDTPKPLTSQQIKTLKAEAHHLNPVVMLGAAGLADTVVKEIEQALTAHGLIKIKLGGESREDRAALMSEICARTGAQPVQSIGKVGVVWREKPEKPTERAAFVPKQKAGERAVKRSPAAKKAGVRRAKSARK